MVTAQRSVKRRLKWAITGVLMVATYAAVLIFSLVKEFNRNYSNTMKKVSGRTALYTSMWPTNSCEKGDFKKDENNKWHYECENEYEIPHNIFNQNITLLISTSEHLDTTININYYTKEDENEWKSNKETKLLIDKFTSNERKKEAQKTCQIEEDKCNKNYCEIKHTECINKIDPNDKLSEKKLEENICKYKKEKCDNDCKKFDMETCIDVYSAYMKFDFEFQEKKKTNKTINKLIENHSAVSFDENSMCYTRLVINEKYELKMLENFCKTAYLHHFYDETMDISYIRTNPQFLEYSINQILELLEPDEKKIVTDSLKAIMGFAHGFIADDDFDNENYDNKIDLDEIDKKYTKVTGNIIPKESLNILQETLFSNKATKNSLIKFIKYTEKIISLIHHAIESNEEYSSDEMLENDIYKKEKLNELNKLKEKINNIIHTFVIDDILTLYERNDIYGQFIRDEDDDNLRKLIKSIILFLINEYKMNNINKNMIGKIPFVLNIYLPENYSQYVNIVVLSTVSVDVYLNNYSTHDTATYNIKSTNNGKLEYKMNTYQERRKQKDVKIPKRDKLRTNNTFAESECQEKINYLIHDIYDYVEKGVLSQITKMTEEEIIQESKKIMIINSFWMLTEVNQLSIVNAAWTIFKNQVAIRNIDKADFYRCSSDTMNFNLSSVNSLSIIGCEIFRSAISAGSVTFEITPRNALFDYRDPSRIQKTQYEENRFFICRDCTSIFLPSSAILSKVNGAFPIEVTNDKIHKIGICPFNKFSTECENLLDIYKIREKITKNTIYQHRVFQLYKSRYVAINSLRL